MKRVIYPGTFDPIHNGHIEIAERAAKLFDELIFVIAENFEKRPFFTVDERMEMIDIATRHIPNVKVSHTAKLTVEFAAELDAIALIRGLRHVSDFEFEFQMAMMNSHLNSEISTLLMMPDEKYIHLNSTVVKDVSKLGGDITKFVPKEVLQRLKTKFNG